MARHRLGWAPIDSHRFAQLERALHGSDPELVPQRAAEALAKSREGTKLLAKIVASAESTALRAAAVYGFVWGNLHSPQFCLLLRVFEDSREHPSVRGQAAEAIGPRLHRLGKRRRHHLRYVRALLALVRGLDDPSPEVRLWSIYALADPENEWLIPKLTAMTTDKAHVPGMWTVRQEALWAISWISAQDLDCDPRTL